MISREHRQASKSFTTLAWHAAMKYWWHVSLAHAQIVHMPLYYYVFCVHSLLPLFCLSAQFKLWLKLHWLLLLLVFMWASSQCSNNYMIIQCAWGPCNHHRGISMLCFWLALCCGTLRQDQGQNKFYLHVTCTVLLLRWCNTMQCSLYIVMWIILLNVWF